MRFRPRFSLRTLFVLLTLISIPMAWVAWSFHRISEREALLQTVGSTFMPGYGEYEVHLPLSLKLFGAMPVHHISVDTIVPEPFYQQIVAAFPEASVSRHEIGDPRINAIKSGKLPSPWKVK